MKNTLAKQLRECKNQAQRLNLIWYRSPSGPSEAQKLIADARSQSELESGNVPQEYEKLLPRWRRDLELRAGRFLIAAILSERSQFKKWLKELDREYSAPACSVVYPDEKLLPALLKIQLPTLPSGKRKVYWTYDEIEDALRKEAGLIFPCRNNESDASNRRKLRRAIADNKLLMKIKPTSKGGHQSESAG